MADTNTISKRKKTLLGRSLAWTVMGALFGALASGAFLLLHDLPQIHSLENYRPAAVTRIFSAEGVLLGELYAEKRRPVAFKHLPKQLVEAVIVTEDRSFYDHAGIDIKGILRALVKNIRTGRYAQGASTLTQQLTKTLFLTPRKTILRKIREAILAVQLERRYTKDEILTFYLNQIYLGSGAYGVQAAAQRYFGKSVQHLDLAECALIAALPKAPSRYSPLVDANRALQRRDLVLRLMHDDGLISNVSYQTAIQKLYHPPLSADRPSSGGHFIDFIRNRLDKEFSHRQIYSDGLQVHTTLSMRYQAAAEKSVSDGLAALAKRQLRQTSKPSPAEAALVAVDVASGRIVAMVGGRSHAESPLNRAVHTQRQAGSAFKPLVYAVAIEQGLSQSALLRDAPAEFVGATAGKPWRPKNYSGRYAGEICLRHALAHSYNVAAVKLLEKVGTGAVIAFAHQAGIQASMPGDLSLALGSAPVSLLDLTGAYAVFANGGWQASLHGLDRVTDASGDKLWHVPSAKRKVMSRSGAAVITDMLRAVVLEGTARPARDLPLPVAGKTGTTDQYRDALFVGFSPTLAAGVWVGKDDNRTLGDKESGSRAALPIWIQFMQAVATGAPPTYFDLPDDTRYQMIDSISGRWLSTQDAGAIKALYRKGDRAPGR